MTRKSTDLLDMFRAQSAANASRKGSAAPASVRSAGREIRLGRRQVILVSSALVLLVVLAFVAGIGIGRGRSHVAEAPVVAARLATTWYIDSMPLPQVDTKGQRLREIALGDLLGKHPEFQGRVEVVAPPPEEEASRKEGKFVLRITGFPDRASAQAMVFQLGPWQVAGGGYPFLSSRPRMQAP